ncbi:hypothetical protein NUW54_g11251 [Trametes sanguinea]|uniref:Uncharacterized protein n=1 Tax=Trametes sanguinea TaxID=158606 RepID=A0ACC1NIH9_9APHY|nr:hypothetical protein NUW54_g11251 [Trametes sanguinea]
MSTPIKPKRLPAHAYLSEELIPRYAKLTEDGIYDLAPEEVFWQERYRYLEEHGYLLRPRYKPGWKPSWTGTNLDPTFCEDSILLLKYQIMDATRLSNRELVAIKSFYKGGQEQHIAQFFASIEDPRNHCVPIREILPDPKDPNLALMVMPYLRPCNHPEFGTVGDVVEFVDQTLEGLVFMHSYRVAHRDIAMGNIMMDAKSLYPGGHHPVRIGYTPDTLYPVNPLPRAGRNVRYLYIDFGWSQRFPEGASTYVLGDVGRDADVPEASDHVPYDAFKVDIFSLGNVYTKFFERKFMNVEFLHSLTALMKQQRPEDRPTAEEALQEWKRIRATLSDSLFRWRLVPPTEAPMEKVINDTVAVAWEDLDRLHVLQECDMLKYLAFCGITDVFNIDTSKLHLETPRSLIGSIFKILPLVGLYAGSIAAATVADIAIGIYVIYQLFHGEAASDVNKCVANAGDGVNKDFAHFACSGSFKVGRVIVIVLYVIFWIITIYGCHIAFQAHDDDAKVDEIDEGSGEPETGNVPY